MKVVILAGGKGTRLQEAVYAVEHQALTAREPVYRGTRRFR